MNNIEQLARPEILALSAYMPAEQRRRFVRLNANESPWPGGKEAGGEIHRYPESRCAELTGRVAEYLGVKSSAVLITRGSDDAIDLLLRVFCRAGQDSVMTLAPGFAMYGLAAGIQGAGVITLELSRDTDFAVGISDVMSRWQARCKLVFLCSPNNPTGALIEASVIEGLCEQLQWRALVVVDEAYVEFARADSVCALVSRYPNLVVLRTLSKAHALAGSRVGALVAHPGVVNLASRVLPPYPLPRSSRLEALGALRPEVLARTAQRIERIRGARDRLAERLRSMSDIEQVWEGEGNFVLVQTTAADDFIRRCNAARVLVRDCSAQPGLENCVRISVGSDAENQRLLRALAEFAHAS